MEHQVIFFRDQGMGLDQHKAFGRLFGELHIHPTAKAPEGHPEIITIHADENSKVVAGMKWHSDVSCDEEPPMGSILHIHTIPDVGGDTMFASGYAAYEALSEPVKALIDGLKGLEQIRTGPPRPFRGIRQAARWRECFSGIVAPNCAHPPGDGPKSAFREREFHHTN